MRCPVPYALAALLGWGLLDAVVTRAHTLVRRLGRTRRRDPGLALSEAREI